ncbi:MAG: glycogen synthase GlgA [Gammaproteobacteria bacterium]|nr:glycogen synthase GlgA [Gammaproteobacteria bacterium]
MKILFATSEAHPLVKTGGLADVCGSLARALKRQRQDVRLILPAYPPALARAGALETAAELDLPGVPHKLRLLQGRLPDSEIVVYLVDSPAHFDRPGGPYSRPDGHDWPDNAQRFAVFARAVTAVALHHAGLSWRPDVVHCHDWQTGLVPALLVDETRRPATVFTIHNLAYQGLFSWETFQSLKVPAGLWSMHAMEFYGRFSFIKGGLVFADWITTVSPNYAREILTPEFGCGLEGLLQHRADRLVGVLNGADYEVWNPAADPLIQQPYSIGIQRLKAINKNVLQLHFDLPQDTDTPLLAHIGRLVEQKGVDLLLEALPQLLSERVQLVVLGSGERRFEAALSKAAAAHRDQMGVHVGYSEELAHRIEAGADVFLMPSRFEPCGLNQIYSQRYGTVPIVRRTGGLTDTVVDANEETLQNKTATGFLFDAPTPQALLETIQRALAMYRRPTLWHKLTSNGMRQNFSWSRSARRYMEIYRRAAAEHAPGNERSG